MTHISEYLRDPSIFQPHKFNLIYAPCGAGKSYFAAHHLLDLYPDVEPSEVMLVTSRSITVAQQTTQYCDTLVQYDSNSMANVEFWRGELQDATSNRICTMTFDKLITALGEFNTVNCINFRKIKIIVIDECHTLVTDRFIKGIVAVTTYLRLMMLFSDLIVIGMTATPEVLINDITTHGFDINLIQPNIQPLFKAKQLTMLPQRSISAFITKEQMPGKTIVMAKDFASAKEMQKLIPHSAVLVSKHNREEWDESDMKPIWDAIVNHSTIPDTYSVSRRAGGKVVAQEHYPLNVLITTSVFREGVSLLECSGVRNIVCGFADAMHVVQLAGRCRYNIDNLVVAYDGYYANTNSNNVLKDQCAMCRKFYHRIDNDYFRLIRGIVQHSVSQTRFYGEYISAEDFRCYVLDRYAVGSDEIVTADKIVSSKEEREQLRAIAKACGLLSSANGKKTFIDLLDVMREEFGFVTHKVRKSTGGQRKQGWYFTCGEGDA